MNIINRLTVGKRKFKELQDMCLSTNPPRVFHHHGGDEYDVITLSHYVWSWSLNKAVLINT